MNMTDTETTSHSIVAYCLLRNDNGGSQACCAVVSTTRSTDTYTYIMYLQFKNLFPFPPSWNADHLLFTPPRGALTHYLLSASLFSSPTEPYALKHRRHS